MFEKSMLYIPYDIESKILRAKGFRVLCLCHLGLQVGILASQDSKDL